MVLSNQRITVSQFDQWRSEQTDDAIWEYIGGEVVNMPSNPYSSKLSMRIGFLIQLHLQQENIDGHVTGEDGLYQVMNERYAPDVAYVSATQQATLPYETWANPYPPQLAVEIVSPNDKERKLSVKIGNYVAAGTLVWVVYPLEQEVEVYEAEKAVRILTSDDTLDGGEVLPDLRIAIRDIFK